MVDLVAQSGLIESVWTQNAGVVLATDATAGDTVLDVESTDILETETGAGQVQIGETVYDYTVDPDALTVTLGSTLDADAVEGTRIESYPLAPVTLARVSLDTGDAPTVRVAAAHVLLLSDGDRNGSEREYVTLYREGSNYVTLDVPNATATVKGGRIDDSAGDLDPSADVVFLDGPPTHYLKMSDGVTGEYVDYATMLADAGSAWAAAVSGLVFDNGSLTVPFIDVQPDGWPDAFSYYFPAWLIPTNGKSCRVLIDSCVADPPAVAFDSVLDRWEAPVWMEYYLAGDDLAFDSAGSVDMFGTLHFFRDESDPAGTGTYKRQWQEHVGVFSDSPASLPADAVYWADTTDFQVDPFQSLNQAEADEWNAETPAGNGTYVALRFNDPVYNYWTNGPSVPGSPIPVEAYGAIEFNLTGVRVVRE